MDKKSTLAGFGLIVAVMFVAGVAVSGRKGEISMNQEKKPEGNALVVYSRSNMRGAKTIKIYPGGAMSIEMVGRSTPAKTAKGNLSREEVKNLVALLDAKEFAALKPMYVNSTVDDGFSLRVTYGDRNIVVENEDVPPALQSVVDQIDNLSSKFIQD